MEPTFEGLIETLNINNGGRGIMTQEQYIEHEIKLRVHDHRFKIIESKLNWILSLLVGGMIMPVFLHFLKLV
jgi:hypothetical protein